MQAGLELTFHEAEKFFFRCGVEFSNRKYYPHGLKKMGTDRYTDLALLLSDQCQHTTKVAVYGDTTNLNFKDFKEFGGSIFKQLEDVSAYLTFCNQKTAVFKGLERIEKSDYPEEALREALLNALIHRDYKFSGSIIININYSGMEFISIGGLLSGMSLDNVQGGASRCRNPQLVEVFHRLGLIKAYGTGIRRIFNLYKDSPVQPTIQVTSNTFKLILPNRNVPGPLTQADETGDVSVSATATYQMQLVLDYLSEYGEMNDEELQELLNVKKPCAFLISRQMVENGFIQIEGHGSKRIYRLK